MDLSLQTKLLRFLQTSTIQPVGAARPIPVDVRIVCATNRDPAEEVRAGRFREDLYYRLHVVPIHLPPLREREDDVLLIARRSSSVRRGGHGLHPLRRIRRDGTRAHPWPGNVRELQNVLRRAVVMQDGEVVTAAMLPLPSADAPMVARLPVVWRVPPHRHEPSWAPISPGGQPNRISSPFGASRRPRSTGRSNSAVATSRARPPS